MLFKNLIGGTWSDTASHRDIHSPADLGDLIGHSASSTSQDVERAVVAARGAFPVWSRMNPQVRGDILDRIGTTILAREEEIGRLLSREEGKTLREARGEVQRAGRIFRFFASETLRAVGDLLPSIRANVSIEVRREPIGVIGLITPWNFPIAIPAWKVAPALAYGNCVILKPAETTPASAFILAEIIEGAGCPAGVFNLLLGSGSLIGPALTGHPEVDAISFTGSQQVGGQIAQACALNLKKFQLEMGGKNPLVVLDDADVDVAVAVAIDGGFFQTGQRCTASSRVIVTAGIHDRFVDKFLAATRTLVVGHPHDEHSMIGPVASERQLQSNLGYVAQGRAEGAELLFGGDLLERRARGWYMAPAVFAGATTDMTIARDEIFGPVVSILTVDDRDEALAVANDTPFGLSGGVVTRSLADAQFFKDRLRCGMVMVNLPTAGVELHAPFGGLRASSMGAREQGPYAREFYTGVKTVYVQN
jgi:acyl-CoA reductase-like NAD-dependent aldehyde dehydrogenase